MTSHPNDETPDWLKAIGHMSFRFWGCPVEGHSKRRAPNGSPVVTVEWKGDVANCTFPGCGRTSDMGDCDRLGLGCLICDHEACGWCPDCSPGVPD